MTYKTRRMIRVAALGFLGFAFGVAGTAGTTVHPHAPAGVVGAMLDCSTATFGGHPVGCEGEEWHGFQPDTAEHAYRIELELVHTLDTLPGDPSSRHRGSSFVWLPPDHFAVVAPAMHGPEISTYRVGGGLVAHRRTTGGGPGEFAGPISSVGGVGQTLMVIDGGGRAHTFLSDLTHLETRRMPVPLLHQTVLANGSIVGFAPSRGEGGDRYMQHLIRAGRDGSLEIERSFGTATDQREELRVAFATPDGGFWNHFPNFRNRLERHSSEADHLRRVMVDRSEEGSSSAILELPEGRLLLLTFVRDEERGGAASTLLELVDPSTGTVLATRHHPMPLQVVRNSGDLLRSSEETEIGDTVFRIWRVRIQER